MDILDHTDEHQPTYMRDLCTYYVGKVVNVYVAGTDRVFCGLLKQFNGAILHLLNKANDRANDQHIYLMLQAVSGISYTEEQ